MERIRELTGYQKFILLLLALMVVGFIVPYATTVSRAGFEYQDAILVPTEENGNTVYSGEIKGTPASFTVTADKTVTHQYGDKTYGPYTVREDATAIPQGEQGPGIEVRRGEEIVFRGIVRRASSWMWLVSEDGSSFSGNITITSSNGIITDENGNVIDPHEPSAATVLELLDNPELTHKGSWWGWVLGVVMCGITAVSILFADQLFRWHLSFRVRDAYDAEPSDWEIASRYISWTIMPIFTLVLFIMGLR